MNYFPQQYYSDEQKHTPLKIDLFQKIHQLQGITTQLENISSLEEKKRHDWLDEHEDRIQEMLASFVQRLPIDMNDPQLDKESSDLVMEYTTHLQQMVAMVHSMYHDRQK